MLFFKFIIFVVYMTVYSYSMSPKCYELSEIECPNYNIGDRELPKTVDGIKNYCSHLISYAHCFERVYEKCTKIEHFNDDEEDVEEFREQIKFVESSCEEDSKIFQGVANNLHCMTSTINNMDEICQWKGLNDTIRETLRHVAEEEYNYGCVLNAWIFYCMTSRFDVECGKDAEYVASEILDGLDYISPHCKDFRSEVPYFEDAFKSEFRRGKYGEAAVPGILEAIRRKVN